MATVTYTTEEDAASGMTRVEWPLMAAGDDGQAFNCFGLSLETIHVWGAPFGSTIELQASNEVSPANFVQILQKSGASMSMALPAGAKFFGSVRPIVTAGPGLAMTILFRRAA